MRLRAVFGAVVVLLLFTGCSRLGLSPASMSFEAVYPSPSQSDVTVHYSLPPAPAGKVYVLWVLNPAEGKALNAGAVPAGQDRSAQAKVNFDALGAVVAVETTASAQTMGTDWALRAGQVVPGTPTLSILDLTPTLTPGATPTPTASRA